jgi:hypothetical protein
VVTQLGFRMRARPVGAYDSSAPNRRAIRDQDFEAGGVLDAANEALRKDYEALEQFLAKRLSDPDMREVHGLLENLMTSCGPDSPNKEEASDSPDPETGLPPRRPPRVRLSDGQ